MYEVKDTALGACKKDGSLVDAIRDKTKVLLQTAKTIESQIYSIQVSLFGKYKAEGENKKETKLSATGLFARWEAEISDTLKHLRIAQKDVEYMTRELNISEPPKEVK